MRKNTLGLTQVARIPVILMVECRSSTFAAGLLAWETESAIKAWPAAAAPIVAIRSRRLKLMALSPTKKQSVYRTRRKIKQGWHENLNRGHLPQWWE